MKRPANAAFGGCDAWCDGAGSTGPSGAGDGGGGSGSTCGDVHPDLKRVRGPECEAGPGAEVEGDAGPNLLDPGAFECPCGPCEYDCQRRAPVRSACACKRLLCRKCAGVAASLPGRAPCGLCGAEAVGPFDAGDFVMDAGVLLSLMGRLEAQEPYVGGDLADAYSVALCVCVVCALVFACLCVC